MKHIYKIGLLLVIFAFISSCSDFLDETPDSRTTIDNADKVRKLIASAYPTSGFTIITELSTDNVVDEGEDNPNIEIIYKEMAYWKDLTQSDNDDTKSGWEACYSAIANANLALESIEKLGEDLKAERAEALMARAYSHFVLVNVFAKHYNPASASTDLGITYMDKSETELNPKYERASVEEVYKKINADIEAALPNISDDIYEQPKYHFNRSASYAFAARFNLYYGKWQKAKEYAEKALSSTSLINWANLETLVTSVNTRAKEYVNDDAVFLKFTDASNLGLYFGAYRVGARINHTSFISKKETIQNKMPEPIGVLDAIGSYSSRAFAYSGSNYKKVQFPKLPYLFEYTDPVAGIGYRRAIYPAFMADETLLVKAEANIHLQDYSSALQDLNMFTKNFFKGAETDVAKINTFYNDLAYSDKTPQGLTQKKKLNPVGFSIVDTNQENMLHYLLQCRRLLTLHDGLRWFDIKRYGIEVNRFREKNGTYELIDQLVVGDKRRAIQIPQDVIASGVTANPR